MYKEYFNLKEMPFSIAPDPRFLFMSERHCEAMAHLLFGVQGDGGFVLLTGEVGTGKTTICRSLIEQLPENINVAFILNPRMNAEELLQTICEEFHIELAHLPPGIKTYVDALNIRLLESYARGRRNILIIDEAQNLDPEVLEQLRLLTNLETNSRKLLQIFLIGQPELQQLLSRPELRQVSQRVIARYHLTHLSQSEVVAYIAHRLRISGAYPLIFPEKLVKHIYRASGGVPRLINLICDRAMLGAYIQCALIVTPIILNNAIKEVIPEQNKRSMLRYSAYGFAVLIAGLIMTITSGVQLQNWNFGLSGGAKPAAVPIASTISVDGTMQAVSVPIPTTTPLFIPRDISSVRSEQLAFQALGSLYGIDMVLPANGAACKHIEAYGLQCYWGHGGLSDLLRLDQPVLLRLSLGADNEFYVVLTDLDKQTASLLVAGSHQRIALSEIANLWMGQFIVIWNVPVGFSTEMALDHRGMDVIWLRQTMEGIDGIQNSGSNVFDLALSNRIRAFQLNEGIQPDGLVGPLTLIRLNVRSNKNIPHLVAAKKG
jgi:general secretion pathway protein A